MWSRGCARQVIAAIALAVFQGGAARASPPADFSGIWKLDREQSDDATAEVKTAAGSQYMQGRPDWAAETILPWGRKFDEGERVLLREVLLGMVQALDTLELDQTAAEIKTIHGGDGIRIFHLERKSAGTSLVTGEKVKRQAKWNDGALVLESSSGKAKTKEVLTLAPTGDQLVHLLRLEMDLLEHPLDLRLVYQRAGAP